MVVGTVIDPDIGDELRVTVVATGLGGQTFKQQRSRPQNLQVVRNGTTGQEERGYEREADYVAAPSESRRATDGEQQGMFDPTEELDYLDIPAFLRVQAD